MRYTICCFTLALLAAPAAAQVPNRAQVVEDVYRTGQYDLTTEAGDGCFTEDVALALHRLDRRFGHLKKEPPRTRHNGHAVDAVLYLSDTPGQSVAVDIIFSSASPAARPNWSLDEPRYSASDWVEPVKGCQATEPCPPAKPCPACPTCPVKPPYPGDRAFDVVGQLLDADYRAAGQTLNAQSATWFARVIYDALFEGLPLEQSIEKHRREWRAVLGLPE